MLAKVNSCSVIGLDATPVEVEVDTARGLFSLIIVGLPDAAVLESRERVRSAVINSGLIFPNQRLTVNLAPASIRKIGPIYDLPIAVGYWAPPSRSPLTHWTTRCWWANSHKTEAPGTSAGCLPWRPWPGSKTLNRYTYRRWTRPKLRSSPVSR